MHIVTNSIDIVLRPFRVKPPSYVILEFGDVISEVQKFEKDVTRA